MEEEEEEEEEEKKRRVLHLQNYETPKLHPYHVCFGGATLQ